MNVSNAFLAAVLEVLDAVVGLYIWLLIIGAVLSWLTAFGVVNMYNRFVRVVVDFIDRLTEPLLRPIRQILPPVAGLDLSPLIVIFALMFLQSFLRHLLI